ncbi:MAG: 2-succinylbenzoate--CoA ligase [Candidatus Hydrogenedentes bacterium ADurb.Bin101]|nr:MAG: 2-succinylbenzoate--CoA ligase [Candidatus Hydrogenedentes bacterium ADurb.Bin101]HOC68531.1 o-succinylbenzoate--CoA ligase [Candidatus Hydrogenedentota bacterium]
MCDLASFIPCPLAAAAQAFPEALACLDDRVYSYAVFRRRVVHFKQILMRQGILQGERVILLGKPSSCYCAALWALIQTGSVACPLNPALPGSAIADIAARLQPGRILHDTGMETALERIHVPRVSFQELEGQAETGGMDALTPMLDGSLPATMVMTSGSTGTAKAAVHSLGNHRYAACAANANMPLGQGDIWLLSLPLYHVSGLGILFRCALAGAAVAIPRQGAPLEEELARTEAGYASLVPTQLHRLMESANGRKVLRNMKGILLGGAPVDTVLVKRAWEAGVPLIRSYGMTETSAQLVATSPDATLEDLYSSGRPLMPGTVRISPEGGIEVRGPSVFLGYYEESGQLKKPETEEGWFPTGDRGYWDGRGRLFVTGRADTMFISGGENIYPEEIEQALKTLAEVKHVAVVGVPDPEYGAIPVAFIALRNPQDAVAETLNVRLRQLLPGHKLPRYYFPWPKDVPLDSKISRTSLCEEAAKHLRQ